MISHRISQMGHLVISKIRIKLNRIHEFGILSTFSLVPCDCASILADHLLSPQGDLSFGIIVPVFISFIFSYLGQC